MGFFKTEVTGDTVEKSLFMAICLAVRTQPDAPVLEESLLVAKTQELLAIGNGKMSRGHLATFKFLGALLKLGTSSEVAAIAKRAIAAADSKNAPAYLGTVAEWQQWLGSHGARFTAPK